MRFLLLPLTVETNMLSTDVKICDNYLLLAVHLMMDVYESSLEDKYLRLCLAWLEKGIQTSSATHQITLLLIYIYTITGE